MSLTPNELTKILGLLDTLFESDNQTCETPPSTTPQSQHKLLGDRPSPRPKSTAKLSTGQIVVTQIRQLVWNILKCSPLPRLETERLLDTLALTVKRQVQPEQTSEPWFSQAARVIIKLIWGYSWTPKLQKKIIKVVVEMERHDASLIEQCLDPFTEVFRRTDICKEELTTWYSFVEVSSTSRTLVGKNIDSVIAVVKFHFGVVFRENQSWTVERQDWLQLLLKMSIQLFQHLPDQIRHLLYITQQTAGSDLADLISYMLQFVASTGVPSHCLPLAGTGIAFLICLCPDESQSTKIFQEIYTKLGHDDPITFGSVVVRVSPLPGYLSAVPSSTRSTSFGHLSLLTGLLSCVRAGMLCQPLHDEQLFASWLFDLVVDFCGIPEHQYHSFRLLSQWYQRVARYMTPARSGSGRRFFMSSSHAVSRTLDLVWTHLDSPVEGINELVIESFDLMLKLHVEEEREDIAKTTRVDGELSETDNNGDQSATSELDAAGGGQRKRKDSQGIIQSELLDDVLRQSLTISWTIKGKHNLVATLLPHIDVVTLLKQEKDIFKELLNCLSTNYLAPASTTLYRTILQELTRNNRLDGFKEHCLPWLVRGLTSDCCLLRQNASQYWLVTTLKHCPDTYSLIIDYLSSLQSGHRGESESDASPGGMNDVNYQYLIHGLIAVMKSGRKHQLLQNVSEEVVRGALRHQDDDVRLDAFGILCVSQKLSEPLAEWELRLLRECLPDNLTSDSAPFRQRMQASVRALLVRLRDSAVCKIKTTQGEDLPYDVINTLDFLDWLWMLLMRSLSPGASYQRLKTSLDWVLLVLDAFTYQPHRHQRKGSTPESVRLLLDLSSKRRQCDFYSTTNTQLILTCLLHGTDEIREMTASILLNFFPWPLPLNSVCTLTPPSGDHAPPSGEPQVAPPGAFYLLQTGLRLCNSAKPHESESGALLIKMIFQKLVVEGKQKVNFSLQNNEFIVDKDADLVMPGKKEEEDKESAAQHFICQLISAIKESLIKTRENTLNGARQTPMHGLLLAVRRCLSEVGLSYSCPDHWAPVIEQLTGCISQITDTVLDVLGGKVHQDETAPSFEEMGLAITATIAESVGDEAVDNELLTNDHRLLMTWAWVNIKESSVLLGSLVESLPLETPTSHGVLKSSQIMAISDVFFKILLQCRHRGAIEGCNLGLARFCEQLLKSSDQQLHDIPKELLTKVLSQIQRSDVTSSVTRRSAGLPLIITSVVTSESKTRQDVLLSHVVTTLLNIADTPVTDQDQRADMPQVHAINILKAILKEASVAMAARKYLAKALIIAIEGFASPHWAIQNAATQLFGALVSRMLGQKRTHEDHVDMMTLAEFFAHYPTLEAFLLTHLETGAADQQAAGRGSLRLQPTTFPVLSILARLSSGNLAHCNSSMKKFHAALTQLLGCPVYAVRELAAQSLSSLTPPDEQLTVLRQTVEQLPSSNLNVRYNQLHGNLVLCCYLLNGLTSCEANQRVLTDVLASLTCKLWLVSDQPSPLVRVRFIQFLLSVSSLCKTDDLSEESHECLDRLVQAILRADSMDVREKVGRDQVVKPLIQWFLSRGSESGAELPLRLKQCLTSNDSDVVLAALETINERIAKSVLPNTTWSEIQVDVWKLVLSDPHCTIRTAALTVLTLSSGIPSESVIDHTSLFEHLMGLVTSEKNSRQAGPALYLTAKLLACDLRHQNSSRLDTWGHVLTDCVRPQNAEWLLLHAARALRTLAPPVADLLTHSPDNPVLSHLQLRLFNAGTLLLVSDHSSVRRGAADFVSHLQAHVTHTLHSQPMHNALALQVLCDISFNLLGSNPLLPRGVLTIIRKRRDLSLSDLITYESRPYVEDLFEAEDTNYYREDVTLAETLCLHLQNRMSKDAMQEDHEMELLKRISEGFQHSLPSLTKYCSGSGPINVSCSQHVYESLWGDLQIMSVLGQRKGPNANTRPQYLILGDILLKYSKIPFLHPHIREMANSRAVECLSR